MKYYIIIFIPLGIFIFNSCASYIEDEIHYIPNEYSGYVYIVFSNCGEEKRFIKNSRVYLIPNDGLLKTKFKPNPGWISDGSQKFYYIDSSGNVLKKLPELYEVKSNKVIDKKDEMENDINSKVGVVVHGYFTTLNEKVLSYRVDTFSLLKSDTTDEINEFRKRYNRKY